MKRPVRILAFLLTGFTALLAVITVMTWPPFTSTESELTGISFDFSEAAFFDDTGMRGEGMRIWIYRIPKNASQRLIASDYPLSDYPMWSALALDGYKRIRWIPSNGTHSNENQLVLKSVLGKESAGTAVLDDVSTMNAARQFAHDLTARDGTLMAGWYTIADDDSITNYFFYVMNLEERLLIKLSLLT